MLPKYHLPFLLRRRNAKMIYKKPRPLLTGGINILYLLIQKNYWRVCPFPAFLLTRWVRKDTISTSITLWVKPLLIYGYYTISIPFCKAYHFFYQFLKISFTNSIKCHDNFLIYCHLFQELLTFPHSSLFPGVFNHKYGAFIFMSFIIKSGSETLSLYHTSRINHNLPDAALLYDLCVRFVTMISSV